MVKRLRQRLGYTMVEIMMVIAIIGVMALIAPNFITQLNRFFILSRARIELQQEARAAMTIMTKDIRQAQNSTIRIDNGTGQPSYSRIRFTTIDGRTIQYAQNGVNLVMTTGTRNNTLTKNLRYLAFTFPRSDDMGILSVSITLEKAIYQGLTKALHMASERVRVMN